MAAGTTSIIQPVASEADVYLEDFIEVGLAAYNGTGSAQEIRVEVSVDSFTSVLHDTGLRESDGRSFTGDAWRVCLDEIGVTSGQTVSFRAYRRNDSSETTAVSSTVSVTAETRVTAAVWRQSQ